MACWSCGDESSRFQPENLQSVRFAKISEGIMSCNQDPLRDRNISDFDFAKLVELS
jgi:hypothetical protein